MEHPANYVGYEWTAAPYAQVTIQHEPVPDRKQINAIAKGLIYKEVLKKNDWWNTATDTPMHPFTKRLTARSRCGRPTSPTWSRAAARARVTSSRSSRRRTRRAAGAATRSSRRTAPASR